jgi:cytochrome c-type biogenesis protein CcmF
LIVELGHYALVLALALALVQGVVPFWGALARDPALEATARPAALAQFGFCALSFAALLHAHVASDFSLATVVENSHSTKPFVYKIAGMWGNHEGSMLLWVFILALFGALVALFSRPMPDDLRALVLAAQAWIGAAFYLFILLTSNPFARLVPAPAEGNDLNPILQDPGLAIHPPLLYLGYVGLSITFSFAAAALISGRVDAVWARFVRPWALLAWLFLTLGIAMGSYWAYYTLGWGGFWFWDPVENASLMPWLAATALLHTVAVVEKRGALKIWTLFLTILAFSLSLLGTFLVRSGVLTSVHAFASDPARGVFILLILVVFIGGAFALFAWRAPMLRQGGLFAPVSREGALVFNNLILTTLCATVFVGTLYPLALEALTGEKISVGAPYYDLAFLPLVIPLALAMPVGQLLAWKRGDFLGAVQRLLVALAAGAIAALIVIALKGGPAGAALGMAVALYLFVGAFADLFGRIARGGSAHAMLDRARGLPRSVFGTAFAHAGLALTIAGLAATGFGVERILHVEPGETVALGPYDLHFDRPRRIDGPNFHALVVPADIYSGGRIVARIEPARRTFATRRMTTTEAGLATIDFGQVYVSITDQENGGIDARLYWKPLVTLIWIGALVMAMGGALSLSDRRVRIGIARRSVAAARATQAAE